MSHAPSSGAFAVNARDYQNAASRTAGIQEAIDALPEVCLDDQEKPTQIRGLDEASPSGANAVVGNHAPTADSYWISRLWKGSWTETHDRAVGKSNESEKQS